MSKEEFIRLYEKYLSGTASAGEERLIHEFKDEFNFSKESWRKDVLGNEKIVRRKIFKRLLNNTNEQQNKKVFLLRRWAIAAVLILIIGVSVFVFSRYENAQHSLNNNITAKQPHEILPATNKAVLTLANGSTLVLDNLKNGTISHQGNASVTKANGNISYKKAGESKTENLFNTLSTPRGGQYHLTLQDGTIVWLNAASSLRFPVSFTNLSREVELTGEAYFEVAHVSNGQDKVPFIVHVKSLQKNMDVQVLGTHFNIMAYDDEDAVATTLLEGSVKVKKENAVVMLKPGEQASLKKDNAFISVNTVDTDNAVAWKNGKFLFDKADIPAVMRQLSRWYDVDVVYKGSVPKQQFWGGMERDLPLSSVLSILKESDLKFEVQDRQLIVSE